MAAYNYYGQNFGNPYVGGYYPQNGFQTQPQMPQPVQQPQQNLSQPTYYTGRIWVNGKPEADGYPVAPNNAVDLWDRNGITLYTKKADSTGRPSLIVYDLVEHKETASDVTSCQDINSSSFATKDELSTIVDAVKSLASEVETMKGDLYGAVGKRKVIKKAEAEDDD